MSPKMAKLINRTYAICSVIILIIQAIATWQQITKQYNPQIGFKMGE